MRLFIALDLPAGRRRELAAWRDAELRERTDLRPVGEEALHVTLVFLGARPENAVAALWECAAGAAASCPSPVLIPTGVAPVPARRPRLFALDLSDEGGRAADLHRAVVGALAGAGLHEPEARPFWPHVTLARLRRGARPRGWSPAEPWAHPFTSSALTLYESEPGRAGARYRVLERLELATS